MSHPQQLPGVRTTGQSTFRKVTRGTAEYLPGTTDLIDSRLSRDIGHADALTLRPGLMLGRTAATRKLRPSIIGTLTEAHTAGTSLDVPIDLAAELARLFAHGEADFTLIGPATAGGTIVTTPVTITAIDPEGTLTLSSTTGTNRIAGSFIAPADGAQTPVTFVPDGDGIRLADEAGQVEDAPVPRFPISGVIDSSRLIPWPDDSALRQWLVLELAASGKGGFIFTHLI